MPAPSRLLLSYVPGLLCSDRSPLGKAALVRNTFTIRHRLRFPRRRTGCSRAKRTGLNDQRGGGTAPPVRYEGLRALLADGALLPTADAPQEAADARDRASPPLPATANGPLKTAAARHAAPRPRDSPLPAARPDRKHVRRHEPARQAPPTTPAPQRRRLAAEVAKWGRGRAGGRPMAGGSARRPRPGGRRRDGGALKRRRGRAGPGAGRWSRPAAAAASCTTRTAATCCGSGCS